MDETLEEHRDGICKAACNLLTKKLREGKVLTTEVREDAYQIWKGKHEEQDDIKRVFMTLPENVVEMAMNISNHRNSMNHFGYSNKGQYSSSLFEKNLKEYNQKFVECMRQMGEIAEKHF